MKSSGTTIEEKSRVLRTWTPEETRRYILDLKIWDEDVQVEQKFGGLQNRTFFVTTRSGKRYAARVGFDQCRTRQTSVVQCTLAAHALGLGPRLVYAEPNLSITEFVEGTSMELEQMKNPATMKTVIERMKILHNGTDAVQETISYWWPFDTVRRYLRAMETGKAATGFQPSQWADRVPRYRDIVNRLERAIGPFHPKLTHNDMVFVNMIFDRSGDLMFIDWDGGAYGHPLWDLGEMLMWAEADEDMNRFALEQYYGKLAGDEMARRSREVHAFQLIAALRLCTEVMECNLDPYFFLTPDEMAESMRVSLPGQQQSLAGLVDLVLPRFDALWAQYGQEFGQQ
jgi:thiamine kinase-like enzyme